MIVKSFSPTYAPKTVERPGSTGFPIRIEALGMFFVALLIVFNVVVPVVATIRAELSTAVAVIK